MILLFGDVVKKGEVILIIRLFLNIEIGFFVENIYFLYFFKVIGL